MLAVSSGRIILMKLEIGQQNNFKRRANFVCTNSVGVQSEGEAEGGCGGNSAAPEPKRSPAALLVQSRTAKKSFVFLLEEKIGRAQIRKCEQNFSLVWRAVASGGGAERQFRSKKVRAFSNKGYPAAIIPVCPPFIPAASNLSWRLCTRRSVPSRSRSLSSSSDCFFPSAHRMHAPERVAGFSTPRHLCPSSSRSVLSSRCTLFSIGTFSHTNSPSTPSLSIREYSSASTKRLISERFRA